MDWWVRWDYLLSYGENVEIIFQMLPAVYEFESDFDFDLILKISWLSSLMSNIDVSSYFLLISFLIILFLCVHPHCYNPISSSSLHVPFFALLLLLLYPPPLFSSLLYTALFDSTLIHPFPLHFHFRSFHHSLLYQFLFPPTFQLHFSYSFCNIFFLNFPLLFLWLLFIIIYYIIFYLQYIRFHFSFFLSFHRTQTNSTKSSKFTASFNDTASLANHLNGRRLHGMAMDQVTPYIVEAIKGKCC